jgi:hypothetical protein
MKARALSKARKLCKLIYDDWKYFSISMEWKSINLHLVYNNFEPAEKIQTVMAKPLKFSVIPTYLQQNYFHVKETVNASLRIRFLVSYLISVPHMVRWSIF